MPRRRWQPRTSLGGQPGPAGGRGPAAGAWRAARRLAPAWARGHPVVVLHRLRRARARRRRPRWNGTLRQDPAGQRRGDAGSTARHQRRQGRAGGGDGRDPGHGAGAQRQSPDPGGGRTRQSRAALGRQAWARGGGATAAISCSWQRRRGSRRAQQGGSISAAPGRRARGTGRGPPVAGARGAAGRGGRSWLHAAVLLHGLPRQVGRQRRLRERLAGRIRRCCEACPAAARVESPDVQGQRGGTAVRDVSTRG